MSFARATLMHSFARASTRPRMIGSLVACAIVRPVTAHTGFMAAFITDFRQTMEMILSVCKVGSPHSVNILAISMAAGPDSGASS